ncbi:winged helix-turn-helix domain-containing protein [Dinoroseobacter sp. S124A]|uniref:winged helix-turn-helix domain-containing protein n=1 Tax=Dinoroseobacter sp. S124A TaxID=3415128 RepID=UPI003C7ACE02
MLRRSVKFTETERFGAIDFERESRSLSVAGTPLDLPRKELAVFECLANSKGRLVSKEALLSFVYGSGADVSASAIEVYVSRLRSRIGPHGVSIKAARGIGYRLEC